MVPEQQQRILGYFIEEAKDHLNTIEQGLLNLQATIRNPEMANEVFRAAHSVKGGAAMLGIESMQRTSHRLEDYFKLLKEAPIQVDLSLESMFLQVFDALQELLEQLQGPFGLTDDKEQGIMAAVEPVFQQLQEHLDQLVAEADANGPSETTMAPAPAVASSPRLVEESALKLVFSSDVSAALREMLVRFKQTDTDASRTALEGCCRLLERFGEQFNLPTWMNLVKHARWAVCDLNNDYRTLAPVLIKEIKKAQDLVLAGQEPAISISETLQSLAAQGDPTDTTDDLDSLFASDESSSSSALDDLETLATLEPSHNTDSTDPSANSSEGISLDELLNDAAISPSGPEVGAAELTSLADLFEAGGDTLDSDWQEEEIPLNEGTPPEESIDIDIAPDFEDLLNDGASDLESSTNDFESGNELADLFGDTDTTETTDSLDSLDTELGNLNGQTTAPNAMETSQSDSSDTSIDGLFDGMDAADNVADVDDLFSDLNTSAASDLDSELDNLIEQTDTLDSIDASSSETLDTSVDDLFDDVAATETLDASVDDLFDDVAATDSISDENAEVDDLFSGLDTSDTKGADDLLSLSHELDNLNELTSSENTDSDNDVSTTDNTSEVDALLSGLNTSEAEGTDELLALSDDLDLNNLDDQTSSENANSDELIATELDLDFESPAATITSELDDMLADDPEESSLPSDSTDSFFMETDEAAAAGTESQNSEFDAFFSIDDSPAKSSDAEELDSLSDDLWTTDRKATAATTSPSLPEDLSGDIWAESSQTEGTTDLNTHDLDNDIAALTEEPATNSDDLDLEDVWASVEDLSLEDIASASEAQSETAATAEISPPAEEDLALDQLLGDDALANVDADNDLESLFGDSEPSAEPELSLDIEPMELDSLAELDISLSDPSLNGNLDSEPNQNDTSTTPDILSEPPASAVDFDLFDLEDDGIVTGFVTDDNITDGTEASTPPVSELFSDPEPPAESQASESLDELLSETTEVTTPPVVDTSDEFGELEALIETPDTAAASSMAAASASSDLDDEFGDLEALLQDTDKTLATTAASSAKAYRPISNRLSARRMLADQTMRVSVSHLDNLSNLVGELVVNRNTLEQDQERLRQFLENLLFQVQQLNDVGQRMRDLYERSLLESSLISSRQSYHMAAAGTTTEGNEDHATGESFDALEMDRFTGFHTLSQEMIELIVRVRESASDIAYTVESSDQVTRQFRQVTNQLQEGLNKARMVPFTQAASRLPRAVRDISLKCGKEARLIVEGRDILIDKMILEQLYDPMTHLVNNAITHGIETPEERRRAGKTPEGLITVRAFYQGNQTVISVGDDGAGIDPNIVKQKALQKRLISQAEAQTMTVLDVYDLLFHPGFSTRDQADDFAGRGFGMDVVRTSLADIRGNITIDSELGRGTNFTIRLPLTLSISKALSCISNQARIAFPMDGVEDMFDVSRERIQKNNEGQDCILWRDTLLPFQNLSDLLSFNRTLGRGRVYGGNQDENMISIVVLRSANSFIALEVDQVMGEQEIVIKQLEGPVPKPTGIAGATVLGDGRVMPIADVLELIDLAMGRVRREPNAALWAQAEEAPPEEPAKVKSEPTVLIVDDSITVRELLSMSFNKVGYRVEQARDGQEAWEKLRSGLPCDLVFCDIEMPRMDGLELLSRLQKDSGLQQIPIAMLTSRGADRHRQMAVDLGASGYFTKPYLEEALLDAANKMLHGERLV
ncbi:hypothetical protein N836_32960 [Leptolyngbya sp. Heron Island J]|uniref:hybrid sensor histidine kinase/response regulator n=1 Tax=Leptolyngbya sp. Heron Island J TaxID=1385935 RepID=UPI0003B98C3F|nr:response regulator [Leptolyngbya sp. Heron Island J]ESA38241.1 hypothetical protein N836_32960 [Leptolyngbya sp. Heron Island J]